MAKRDRYLSYEQALQELQINRSQLNQFIREGRLREHVISGETKFRQSEVMDLKQSLAKRPTIVAGDVQEEERTTDILGEAEAGAAEPPTEMLEEAGEVTERETELLGEEAPLATEVLGEEEPMVAAVRETERLPEEQGFELEGIEVEQEELERPLAEEAAAGETTLETELDLAAVRAEAAEGEEEEFFDFAEAMEEEFELETGGREGAPGEEAEEEIITDIIEAPEEEIAEEDLLSEIMDIEEEAGEETAAAEEEEITADITAIGEPTFEGGELTGALEAEPKVEEYPEAAEEAEFGEEFEVPYAAAVPSGEVEYGALPVVVLLAAIIVLAVAGLFVVENAFSPAFSTPLTSWAMF